MKLIIVKCVQSGGGGQRVKKWNNKQNKLVYREYFTGNSFDTTENMPIIVNCSKFKS